MAGQGSGGNVIAALMFVLAGALWVIWLGWIIHLWSILDAAKFDPNKN